MSTYINKAKFHDPNFWKISLNGLNFRHSNNNNFLYLKAERMNTLKEFTRYRGSAIMFTIFKSILAHCALD